MPPSQTMTKDRRQLIKSAILTELKKRGKSKYWLAIQAGMHANDANRALSDSHDMRVSTAEKMLKALGLTVSPENPVIKNGIDSRA